MTEYLGPIDLEKLVQLGTSCPYTFLAFPISLVGKFGVPTDEDAQRYIAAVQAEDVPVGIWLNSPVPGTAYAAVQHDSIALLHLALEKLDQKGEFHQRFAANLSERLLRFTNA